VWFRLGGAYLTRPKSKPTPRETETLYQAYNDLQKAIDLKTGKDP